MTFICNSGTCPRQRAWQRWRALLAYVARVSGTRLLLSVWKAFLSLSELQLNRYCFDFGRTMNINDYGYRPRTYPEVTAQV